MFDKSQPDLVKLMNGEKFTVHIYIELISINKVEANFEFLYEIYKQKDILCENFIKFGNFGGENAIAGIKLKQSRFVLLNAIFWMTLNGFIVIYWIIAMIESGRLLMMTGILGIFIALCEF